MHKSGFSSCCVRLALAACAVCCLLAAGCSSPGRVLRIESSGGPLEPGKRFLVVPGVMEIKPKDTKFKAVAAQLSSFLVSKGYVQVSTYEEADLAVYLAYAVKGSVRAGQAPGGGFLAPLAATQLGISLDAAPTPGFMGGGMFGGGGPHRPPEIKYDLSFLIEAVDLQKFKRNDPKHIQWQLRVATAGLSDDVDRAMPYVLAAVSEYIGKSAYLTLEVDDKLNVTVHKPSHPKRMP